MLSADRLLLRDGFPAFNSRDLRSGLLCVTFQLREVQIYRKPFSFLRAAARSSKWCEGSSVLSKSSPGKDVFNASNLQVRAASGTFLLVGKLFLQVGGRKEIDLSDGVQSGMAIAWPRVARPCLPSAFTAASERTTSCALTLKWATLSNNPDRVRAYSKQSTQNI